MSETMLEADPVTDDVLPASPDGAAPARIDVGGVRFDPLTLSQTIEHIADAAQAGRGGWVITANLDHARRARVDDEYRDMLGEAELVVADGAPIIWASRVQGAALPERVAGSSMVEPLAAVAAERGLSIYLMGGTPGTAKEAGDLLASRYPGLRIAGVSCPPMGFEKDPAEMAQIRESIGQARPDIVYVALGSPKQERLIRVLRGDFPGVWWLGIGISLSFLTGEVQRAPSYIQRLGLEWCHRLVQEPRRLAKRYLVHGLPYAFRLGLGSFWRRLSGKTR
ncbi:MAG: WecB/TagA/CpsF family glycosyltransferase [Phycisphaerales bacterium JB063]